MSDDRRIEDAPPAWGASVRLNASLEPEAARVLDELVTRLYPDRRMGRARGLVVEMAIRALHHRVFEQREN